MDAGLLAELQGSKKYVLPYELEEQARKERTLEMARALKLQNVETSIIAKVFGLSKDEIEGV